MDRTQAIVLGLIALLAVMRAGLRSRRWWSCSA